MERRTDRQVIEAIKMCVDILVKEGKQIIVKAGLGWVKLYSWDEKKTSLIGVVGTDTYRNDIIPMIKEAK